MQSLLCTDHEKSQDSGPSATCALWPVDLRLTHLDWSPEATLIHFQGQYLTTCELDYNILQREIQNVPKSRAAVDIGEFCLVEDLTSARWFRGRVQNRKEDLFDVFLIDYGNVLSVDIAHISSCSNDLLFLPPKIVCGFLSNVLLLQSCSHSFVDYLSSLTGKSIKGFMQAVLPHSVILLEALDINNDLVQHGFGRHVDTDTFLLLVEMLTDMPLKQNIPPPPDLIIDKSRQQQFSFKSYSLKGYKDFLSFCGPRLSCGTSAKVRVTAAVNPGLFFCQMVHVKTDLWQMSKKLAAICELRTEEQNGKTPENLGQLCAVKRKDGNWYRGFLQFLPVNSQVRVLFIDYGFSESVKVEDVHRLPPNFYSSPIMAFPCALSSLTNQDTATKTEQLDLLKAGLLGEVLEVEISGFDEEQHLYTITFTGSEDRHVGKEPSEKLPSEPVIDPEKASPQGGFGYYETVMGEALGTTLAAEEVQVGSVFVGYVEHAQDPNHFWIRTQRRNDEFEEMMGKMADYFSEVKLDEDILLNPEVGAMCCALYEKDMHFYRGVVTDTLEHGAEVLFIDFGNIEKVPHMLIKNIPKAFASQSAFAVCCTLANVFPSDDFWSSVTCDSFRKAVSDRALLVRVVQIKKNKFAVDLYEIGSDKSITELLVSLDLAEYFPTVRATGKSKRLKCTVTSDISGKSKQWEKCKQKENLFKNEIDKVQPTASFKTLNIKPGFEFAVRCPCINSPSDFWCQHRDKVPALEKLMEEVQQYYSAHKVPLQPGESCCVVKSPQDGRWYRGFIIGKQKGHVAVVLADYGSIIQVREHSLQAVMPKFLCLEGQAFRCSLYDVTEPADHRNCGDWSPEACSLLKDFVIDSADGLRCVVVSQLNVKNKGLCNVVFLYNAKTQESVANTFIKQGLAVQTSVSTKQHSAMFPESFVYSSFDLNSGDEEQVFVTHINSQFEIYCHLQRNIDIIEKLERRISDEIEKLMQASTRSVVKKLCLAKYLDGKWYRGSVLPTPSPLHLSVIFVDYGNAKICEKNKVAFIPRDCADLLCTPMQAVRCNLISVPKEELYADAKEWLNAAVLNKLVRAVIRGKREDGSFDVELFDGEININEKVKELVLNLKPKPVAAVSFATSSTKTKGKTRPTKNTNQSIKRKTLPKEKTSTPKVLEGRRNPKMCQKDKNTEVKQQVQNKRNDSAAVRDPRVRRQEERQDAKSKPTQHSEEAETPQFLCLPNKMLSVGFRAQCYVSHIDSVCSFFLQLSEDESAILKMYEDLNSTVLRDSLKTASSLKMNDVALAEFEEDGALYRSVLKTAEDGSCFKVEFVDYGNSAVVRKEKIYPLPTVYRSQPRFSIPCSLLNTSTYENEASFTDAVMEKPLMVDFIHLYGIQWHVKVEILDQEVGLDATFESSCLTVSEASQLSSADTEEEVRSCEQNLSEDICQDEKSVGTMSADEGRNSMPESAPVTLPTKLKVKPFRRLREQHYKKKSRRKTQKRGRTNLILPPTLKARDMENGTVLSVQSNGSFYITLSRSSNLLMALERLVSDNICKCRTVDEDDIKQGLKCLVQVEDNRWQRAVVLHVNEEKSKVFLVDHGITKDIPSGSIRHQSGDLAKFPNLAVLCKMNSFGFGESEDACKYWWETLQTLIGTEVRLVFVRHSEDDHLWMVEIVMSGLFLTHQIKASLQQFGEKTPSPAETQREGTGEKKGLVSDRSAPQRLVCAPLDTDRAYSGFAAAVTSPFEFCVILDDLFPIENKVSIMLDNLSEPTAPLPDAHLVPGTCCMLKSDSRNKWCRAVIVHVDAAVGLRLVDYGDYECIPYCDVSKLKQLLVEPTKLPKVTCSCVLRGVEPVGADGQWTSEAVVFFRQCLYQKTLQISFTEFVSNSHWKVDILADGVHVAKELVVAGHANYVDVLLGLRFQMESSSKPLPQGPEGEEEEGPEGEEEEGPEGEEEEGSEVEDIDGPERKMSVSADSRSSQCFLM
ncbi:tudor domain-containing protein 15 [Odontesthes bonariensis]|uniref:tudor domain-containing protein 15 n=1 Tax=Odontesthes bonariensis TaxID=219752 RepID=UPI003F58D72A